MNKEYYSGAQATVNYLRPTREKYIPLVELPPDLNPYLEEYDIHINAKLMNTLPLGNVKSLPAWHMLEQSDVHDLDLVEASSGNTVLSLGILAQYFGAKSVSAIASPDISDGKLALLKLAGVNVTLVEGPICPNPNDLEGAINLARREGEKPGKLNLGQYDNNANPEAHERITGPQLYDQIGNNIGMFCAGLGTTGTLLGTAHYLATKIPSIKIGGIVRAANNSVPGVRTINGLGEVSFPWHNFLTEPLVEISEKESYEASLALIRTGLLVGPSAGFAYAGTLQHLKSLEKTGEINTLRGKHVVFICPDSPFPYMADYEKALSEKHFPIVENMHLRKKSTHVQSDTIPEVDVATVLDMISNEVKNVELVDVREPDEYNDHHLPNSINIPLATLPDWIKTLSYIDTKVIFICRSGNRSAQATQTARLMGIDGYNMTGGTIEWSACNYPRVKSPFCVT